MLAASSVHSRLGAPCPLRSAATSRISTVDVVAAQKKGAGSTKNGRNSNAQRRGVKVYGGQPVRAGGIIVRQLGTVWYPGTNTDTGKDFTLFSTVDGIVVYDKKKEKPAVHVYPFDHAKAIAAVGATHTTKPKEGTQSRAERRKTQYSTRRTTPAVSVATVAVSPMP